MSSEHNINEDSNLTFITPIPMMRESDMEYDLSRFMDETRENTSFISDQQMPLTRLPYERDTNDPYHTPIGSPNNSILNQYHDRNIRQNLFYDDTTSSINVNDRNINNLSPIINMGRNEYECNEDEIIDLTDYYHDLNEYFQPRYFVISDFLTDEQRESNREIYEEMITKYNRNIHSQYRRRIPRY